ncbi:hypothetical protein Y030_6081 [Burkholderia pseudomallei MSHR332]|nr:hypothetical protein Y030_6081 [Burkholderia pseudomallei MSHR332]
MHERLRHVQRARGALQRLLAQPHHLERGAAARGQLRERVVHVAQRVAHDERGLRRQLGRRHVEAVVLVRVVGVLERLAAARVDRRVANHPRHVRDGLPDRVLVRKIDELHEHVVHHVLRAARAADEAARELDEHRPVRDQHIDERAVLARARRARRRPRRRAQDGRRGGRKRPVRSEDR